ncbi:MAG TPA: NAD(P)H-dependent oxidoreductase, partial [Terriglobia bacterium]|nr:NAD(P)H-dependent oxidoreductase [Terriglobia bacterium]
MDTRPLFIPVILGTVRKGRASENVAKFVFGEVQKHCGVETELIDLLDLTFATDDAGEAIKESKFSETVALADGL